MLGNLLGRKGTGGGSDEFRISGSASGPLSGGSSGGGGSGSSDGHAGVTSYFDHIPPPMASTSGAQGPQAQAQAQAAAASHTAAGGLSANAMTSLYGTDEGVPRPTFKLSDKAQCFRLVVLQDSGLRSKQTLFDSALGLAGANPNSSAYHRLNKTVYHSMNELAGYMFGYYGILVSETRAITKVHYLPSLPNLPCSVLVTRLFSLDPTFEPVGEHQTASSSADWLPHPTIVNNDLPRQENMSTRFSIGFILPVGRCINNMEEEITDNWNDIANELITLQQIVTDRLRNSYSRAQHMMTRAASFTAPLSSSPSSSYHSKLSNCGGGSLSGISCSGTGSFDASSSRRPNYPQFILQADYELNQEFHTMVRTMRFLVETPRLFVALKDSNQVLINWAAAVSAWLELKDGRYFAADPISPSSEKLGTAPGLRFLASLCSIILPLRRSILEDPMCRDRKKLVRVIVVTSNPIVSQKLIFILSGLLGYESYSMTADLPSDATIADSSTTTTNTCNTTGGDPFSSPEDSTYQNESHISETGPKPISIKRQASEGISFTDSSSPPSGQSASSISQSWRIPAKSSAIISSSPTVQNASVTPQAIRVPHLHRESSYASLQNLSSSYGGGAAATGQSLLSTSSSWRGAFGSFMERWKMSGGPSGSRGSSALPSMSPPKPDFAPPYGNPSSAAMSAVDRTPSPAGEYDEYPWKVSGGTPVSSVYKTLSRETTSSSPFSHRQMSRGPCVSHTFVSEQKFNMPRSTTRLTIPEKEVQKHVARKISAIMEKPLDLSYRPSSNGTFSVVSVEDKINSDDIVSPPTNKLPTIGGYTERYNPVFSFLSCAQPGNLETNIIEAMNEDVMRMGADSVSQTYVVSLRQREVKLVELEHPGPQASTASSGSIPVPPSPNLAAGFQRNQMKSKLTHDLERRAAMRPKVSVLFAPTMHKHAQKPLPGVDSYDEKLNEISRMINAFFIQQHAKKQGFEGEGSGTGSRTGSGCVSSSTASMDEYSCCDRIRGIIVDLLKI